MTSRSIHDADALLLYRVGPVHCCSPTFPVESVIMPPHLTQPPGTTVSEPGMFKTAQGIVKAVDLRKRFGVDEKDWSTPGRIVVIEVEGGHAGIWVDEIIDVIQSPLKGWGGVPACIPKDVFTKTLLLDGVIQLYADFENIFKFREVGYLRQHIETLKEKDEAKKQAEKDKPDFSLDNKFTSKVAARKNNENESVEVKLDEVRSESESLVNPSSGPELNTNYIGNTLENGVRHDADEISKAIPGKTIEPAKNKLHQDKLVKSVQNKIQAPLSVSPETKSSARSDYHKHDYSSSSQNAEKVSTDVPGFEYRDRAKEQQSTLLDQTHSVSVRGDKDYSNSDDSMTGYYMALLMVVLLSVCYGVFLLFSPVDESSEYIVTSENPAGISNAIGNSGIDLLETEESVEEESKLTIPDQNEIDEKNYVDGSLIKETSREENSLDEGDINSEYHAAIKKDKEGLVIVLTQQDKEEGIVNNVVIQEEEISEKIEEQFDKKDVKEAVIEKAVLVDSSLGTDVVDVAVVGEPVKETVPNENVQNITGNTNKMIIHIVVKGDTLWHIAKRYIHNPFRYPELARLSHIKDPDLIYPGNKVKIIFNNK